MIQDLRVIAVIPARGGSKSIPKKNIRPLAGKPLLAWSIEAAHAVPEIDRNIVSTDDAEIGGVAREFGAEVYVRPGALATDKAIVIDALRHLIGILQREGEQADIMVLLEPTCPLRAPADIRECIIKLVSEKLDSVATFKPAELNPHRAWRVEDGVPRPFISGTDPWKPRQELPPAYQLNGAVYAFRTARLPADSSSLLFGQSGAIVMPPERSIDIDRELDLIVAEAILKDQR